MSYNRIQQYAKAGELGSISKSKRIILLYEGCITFIKKARQAIISNNIQDRYNYINKASKIIEGFRLSLDFDQAEELACILDNFYSKVYLRLIKINFEKDYTKNIDECDKIIAELEDVLSSWRVVDEQLKIHKENTASTLEALGNKGVMI